MSLNNPGAWVVQMMSANHQKMQMSLKSPQSRSSRLFTKILAGVRSASPAEFTIGIVSGQFDRPQNQKFDVYVAMGF